MTVYLARELITMFVEKGEIGDEKGKRILVDITKKAVEAGNNHIILGKNNYRKAVKRNIFGL